MKGKKKKKGSTAFWRKWWFWTIIIVAFATVTCSTIWYVREFKSKYQGEETRLYIPHGATSEAISDTLKANLGEDFGKKVFRIWSWRDGVPERSVGSYKVTSDMSALEVGRKLLIGAQDPIKVTFNNVRTMQQLADKISTRLEFGSDDFLAACDSVLPDLGFTKPGYPAAFFPDTYEFYWSADPKYVVKRLVDVRSKYWDEKHRELARQLGLTPVQVATIASIVEEETAKADERPMVARLYINRLKHGMRLQADPTVKFAIGDFSLRRILNSHLTTPSPYNTYMNDGLPPGPIRIVERKTLDDVLYAPEHDYLYMCAKEDFSGYHNFARNGSEHLANAARYHAALNKRKIK